MATRTEKFPFGIPGVDLTEREREVPDTEPPAWPINEKLKHVGKSTKRFDAALKVTGRARFTADVRLPRMLFAKMLRSPHPNTKVRSIDVSAAEALAGVYAVHVLHNRLTGAATGDEGELPDDERGFPDVKFAGQALCGVAAVDNQTAERAISLIRVEYEPQPHVITIAQARAEGAPLVYTEQVEQAEDGGGGGGAEGLAQQGNVRGPNTESFLGGPRGDTDLGFRNADLTVEGTFITQVQTHCPLETHGLVADWQPDGLTVYASTQDTKGVRGELAARFDLPKAKVRVICEYMGGGFGAKYGIGSFGTMAVELSRKAGRPVSLMLDRKEEHLSVGNRPNTEQFLKIGAKRDGTLVSIKQESYGSAGIGLGAGVGRVAQALYPCPNFLTEQYDVFTNTGPGAAWRAPGNPQGAFALEQLVDELAEKLGLDPLAYRDKIDESKVRRAERQLAAEKFGWDERKPANSDTSTVKRGLGVAQSTWPRLIEIDSTAEVRLYRDGTVEIRSSVMDIGTGTRTILAQVVAEELGIAPEDVTVRIGDTIHPAGPASGGSKVTGSITPAARNAAYKAGLLLRDEVAKRWEVEGERVGFSEGRFSESLDGVTVGEQRTFQFKEALAGMRTEQLTASASREDDYGGFKVGTFVSHGDLGSVQMVEVSVDTETGFVKVERVCAVHSCGRPINPMQIQSQVNGGVIQGLSYALYEDRVMDERTGNQLNPNLDQYKIAFSMEIPEIEVYNIEEYSALSSTDAFGIAEPANIATAAAVANAVYNAIGVRIYELPITPARVLEALGKV